MFSSTKLFSIKEEQSSMFDIILLCLPNVLVL
jgi:hypothetical protein